MAFRSESSNSTAAHPLVITAPAGIQVGDTCIIFTCTDSFSTSTYTWPTDFSSVSGSPLYTEGLDASDFAAAVGVLTTTPASFSISNSNSRAMIGGILCFSGRATAGVPQAASANAVEGADPTPWD